MDANRETPQSFDDLLEKSTLPLAAHTSVCPILKDDKERHGSGWPWKTQGGVPWNAPFTSHQGRDLARWLTEKLLQAVSKADSWAEHLVLDNPWDSYLNSWDFDFPNQKFRIMALTL